MTLLRRSFETQSAIDALNLVGKNLFVALDELAEFEHQFKIEWGVVARSTIEHFDENRIRVWYNDDTRVVTAIVHG